MQTTHSTTKGATIMIVEDNEDLRENATLVLTLEGYKVCAACDGQDAIDMLESGKCHPDLIVSDIAMPRIDGYAFFKAVHEMPTLRTVPFIFLTARGSARDVRLGKQLGVDDYLPKPFNAADFLVAIENRLRRAAEMRSAAEEQLNDARRTMVQLLSHELRTPLTYVTGGFSLLADGLEQQALPEDIRVSMNLISSGAQRLTRLAEQMVIYAELISGHTKLQLDVAGGVYDIGVLLKNTISNVRRDFRERRITFTTDIPNDESIDVFTISELFGYAVYEVLRNAATYCVEGSSVEITLTKDGDSAVTMITDHGWGIPAEDQVMIWNVMIQSDRARYEQQGAGMGLPIVKQIIIAHGGSVALQSTTGQGTSIRLFIPIYHPEAHPEVKSLME